MPGYHQAAPVHSLRPEPRLTRMHADMPRVGCALWVCLYVGLLCRLLSVLVSDSGVRTPANQVYHWQLLLRSDDRSGKWHSVGCRHPACGCGCFCLPTPLVGPGNTCRWTPWKDAACDGWCPAGNQISQRKSVQHLLQHAGAACATRVKPRAEFWRKPGAARCPEVFGTCRTCRCVLRHRNNPMVTTLCGVAPGVHFIPNY